MKYYIDTEFLEGTQKEKFPINLFKKNTPPTIDLISIGICSSDGREYYTISKDFNLKEAWNRYDLKYYSGDRRNQGNGTYKEYWLRENVLMPIYWELYKKEYPDNAEESYNNYQNFKGWALRIMNKALYKEFKFLINKYGKTNKQIAKEIVDFVGLYDRANTQFYAYYADYDWVAFCWLFGKMIDLPKGFPMYCIDLKQELDRKVNNLKWLYGRDIWGNTNRSIKTIGKGQQQEKDKEATFNEKLSTLKKLAEYPKQTNEHNALADAKWNKKLHEFLININKQL